MSTSEDTTRTLIELSRGDERAADKLAPVVYEKLRALAQQYMQRERPDHTLQATALLNEAYVKLIDQSKVDWKSKTHFVAVAAEMMRRILVDHARRHAAAKHGGGWGKIPLEGDLATTAALRAIDVIALDEALEELKKLDSRQARAKRRPRESNAIAWGIRNCPGPDPNAPKLPRKVPSLENRDMRPCGPWAEWPSETRISPLGATITSLGWLSASGGSPVIPGVPNTIRTSPSALNFTT